MPLTAIVAERRIEAWTLTTAEWLELKRDYRRLGCRMSCGERGHPKTSPLGTQYFAHFPKTKCDLHEGGPEGPEHLRAKAILADTARAAGWAATVEFPAPDRSWIADVLIERAGVRMALEVQWSPQSSEDFVRRQQRYEAAGVKGRWFVAERNRDSAKAVPSFVIAGSVEELFLEVPPSVVGPDYGRIPLANGLQLLLAGSLKSYVEVRPVRALVDVAMTKCWTGTCGRWLTLWRVVGLDVITRCGEGFRYANWYSYQEHQMNRTEYVMQGDIVPAIDASDLPRAVRYDTRHDKVRRYHKAMICPHCNVVFGDRHVNDLNRRWTTHDLPINSIAALPTKLLRVSHLCRDAGHGQCTPPVANRSNLLIESSWAAQKPDDEPLDPLPPRGSRKRTQRR